jgi:hypothetical protein
VKVTLLDHEVIMEEAGKWDQLEYDVDDDDNNDESKEEGEDLSRSNISTGKINCFYRYIILY